MGKEVREPIHPLAKEKFPLNIINKVEGKTFPFRYGQQVLISIH